MDCIRELVWVAGEPEGQWQPVWHIARGAAGDNPRPIACGDGAAFTIIDPHPAQDRSPTCDRCRAL